MRLRAVAFVAILASVALAAPVRGGERDRRAEPPLENVSYVPADEESHRKAWAEVDEAIREKTWLAAARGLQRIVEGPRERVVAVGQDAGEGGVFEGSARVAHHRVLLTGAELASAYEDEFGGRARAIVDDAVARRDPSLLERAADTYLPSAAGRSAATMLADLAIESGDIDGALGWLARLQDLEEVASPALATAVSSWRRARIAREAVARASGKDAKARVRTWLENAVPGAERVATAAAAGVRAGDLRRPEVATAWPTAGGDATRARAVEPLPGRMTFAAVADLHAERAMEPAGEADARGRGRRPSPWLPPRAVVAGDRVIVSDGRFLKVFSLRTQALALPPVPLVASAGGDAAGERGQSARSRWGWIEGFGLTVDGDVVYATVPSEHHGRAATPGDPADAIDPQRRASGDDGDADVRVARQLDRVVAIRLDDDGGRILWTAGGGLTPGLPPDARLYGTPLLYRGALHVVALVPTKASRDRFDAWHVSLHPRTGAVRTTTFLGAGGPIRRRRADEAYPASCSGAHGRVYVLTSLGIASAIDARSGRTEWTCRYDRGRSDGDDIGTRLSSDMEMGARKASFTNHPPLVSDGLVFLTPTDATMIFALHDRPRRAGRELKVWAHSRTLWFRNLAVEQLAGVTDGAGSVPATLVGVGEGYGQESLHDPFTCVVGMDPATGVVRWERTLGFGGIPEPFGLALVTQDEALVPTALGIARYSLVDGSDRAPLDGTAIPASRARLLYPDEMLYGNLVPVPGRGVIAVNESDVAFWLAP